MAKVIITRGVPGSGKTTWALGWVEDGEDRIRINRDDLRFGLFGRYWGVDEVFVTKVQDDLLKRALREGRDVVMDATNLVSKNVRSIAKIAFDHGAAVEFRDFSVPLQVAIDRDAARDRQVGAGVIRDRFFSRFHINPDTGKLPPAPELIKGDRVEFTTYTPDPSKPEAFGFDLDGTLAHMTGRSPYDPTRYHEDVVDEPLRHLAWLLSHHADIIVFSGRSEEHRKECEDWLIANGIPYDQLVMRKAGDTRNDAIVKSELFDEFIAPNYNVIAHFDDRNRVVEALRAKGIKVLQVAEGDF